MLQPNPWDQTSTSQGLGILMDGESVLAKMLAKAMEVLEGRKQWAT